MLSQTLGGSPQFLCKYMQIQLCEGMHIHCTQCEDLSSRKHNVGQNTYTCTQTQARIQMQVHSRPHTCIYSPLSKYTTARVERTRKCTRTHTHRCLHSHVHIQSHTYTQIRLLLGLRKMALGDPWQRLWFPVSGLDTATSITNPDLSPATKLKNKNKKK